MPADALAYDLETGGRAAKLKVRWLRSEPVARSLYTDLSDDEIRNSGLLVHTKIDLLDFFSASADADLPDRPASQWLVRGPANDAGVARSTRHDWLASVERRIGDLRDIAAEEDLAFDEESAAAALAFLHRLPPARRPGAFLVGGNVRLLWDAAAGEQVGLQFRGAGRIQFVIFQSDGDEPGSVMGVRPHDAVLKMLAAPDVRSIIAR